MKKFFSNKYICMLTAVFCTLLWGTAYPLIKLAYADMSIITVPDKLLFAGLRFFIAGLMVFVVCFMMRKTRYRKIKDTQNTYIFSFAHSFSLYIQLYRSRQRLRNKNVGAISMFSVFRSITRSCVF